MDGEQVDCLVSLPPAAVAGFKPWNPASAALFVCSDPPGRQLGSGGGTAHLLDSARRAGPKPVSFEQWLAEGRKLIVHGSGQSRRLPAYAAEGKPLLPLPSFPGRSGQAPDQRLIDLQIESFRTILRHAPASYRVMVTCGDVLLVNAGFVPSYPDADVLIAGLQTSAEEASLHGVMFCPDDGSGRLGCFLQKPAPERIREIGSTCRSYLDTGVWLLSARAVAVLLARCGWDADKGVFAGGGPSRYELFDTFGPALGSDPAADDAGINSLRAAVLPLPKGRFYHFGTNSNVIMSVAELGAPGARGSAGRAAADSTVIAQNSVVAAPVGRENRMLWIENSSVPACWRLRQRHVLTGIPPNNWPLDLPAGACLDIVALRGRPGLCIRVYGFDDEFRGPVDSPQTAWFGRPAADWFRARGIEPAQAGVRPGQDIQSARIFPLAPPEHPDLPRLLQWLLAAQPAPESDLARLWLELPRFSADDLLQDADTAAREAVRRAAVRRLIESLAPGDWQRVCARTDLEALARMAEAGGLKLPPPSEPERPELPDVHDAMLRARLGRTSDDSAAFARLRELMTCHARVAPVAPRRAVLEDQIVWGRAPARLDFAGGWTDTPPYCLEHGGLVVNLAVDLNGQPPVQVFARICEKPHLVIHSIDLGTEETIRSTAELTPGDSLGSGFGIARAAFRLAGFDPRFRAGGDDDLPRILKRDFGGGIELSMLAAIPKGSGLGTSSILAATILGTLGELCGLQWSEHDLFHRTLALEQILTSGGGWQDQVGGVVAGLKLVKTEPGLVQKPVVRWLPHDMIEDAIADRRFQLYYTGITRVAHSILGEIVRGIFLNDGARLDIIRDIAHNAEFAADSIQRRSWDGFCEAVRRSWRLNRALDAGTNPPGVRAILERIEPWLAGAKLLGAGGGGYLAILTAGGEDGHRVRGELLGNPPNSRARFVELSISKTGLQITRS